MNINMNRLIDILLLVTLGLLFSGTIGAFGCAGMAIHNGAIHVSVSESRAQAKEVAVWEWTLGQYNIGNRILVRPVSRAGSSGFVQLAWETRAASHTHSDKGSKPVAFYSPALNEVWYQVGDFASLVHEYAHAIQYQLGLRLAAENDEQYARTVEALYDSELRYHKLKKIADRRMYGK